MQEKRFESRVTAQNGEICNDGTESTMLDCLREMSQKKT